MNDKNTNNEPLTEEQRELAEKNHDLIYGYAHKKNISIDELYGVLAIGLCKAAKIYDESKGRFSTLAYKCMENELNTYWKSLNKKSVVPNDLTISYDFFKEYEEYNCIENYSNYCDYNIIINDVILNEFVNTLTNKEKDIFNCLLNEFTHQEIACKFNCSKQNIGYCVKRIRKKARAFFNNS